MNKYFIIKPSAFWSYDDVDIEGNYPEVTMEDFHVTEEELLDPRFNYLFFEVPCKEKMISGKTVYGKVATELISKNKFNVEVTLNPITGTDDIQFYSDELGLYMTSAVELSEAEITSSKASGLLKYLSENEELFREYCRNLDSFTESARFYKERHDETIDGPNNGFKKQLSRGFHRNIK